MQTYKLEVKLLHSPLENAPKHFTPMKPFCPCYGTLQIVGLLLLLLRLLFYNVIVKAVIFCRCFTVPCFWCHIA